MLKDITLGQFFPGDSILHRLDARCKLILTLLFILMLFINQSAVGLVIGGVYTLIAVGVSKIPFRLFLKSLKPILPILVFTSVLNLLFIEGGDTYFAWKFIKITEEGVQTSVFMIFRIIFLILGSSLLTYTTSPIALTDGIESLLSPLKKLHLPVHELAMMMTIALRFIPTLIEETDKIISAQKARGADMETGGLMHRAKALVPILIPLFVSSFRRAEELATAMECRCYRGGEGRTRLRQPKTGTRDVVALCITLVFLGAVVAVPRLI